MSVDKLLMVVVYLVKVDVMVVVAVPETVTIRKEVSKKVNVLLLTTVV